MQQKRRSAKFKPSTQLEIGKIYKITTTVEQAGERQVLLPAFFYFKAVSSDTVTYTINARILRAGDTKAWDLRLTTESMRMLSEYVCSIDQVIEPKELTKVKVRGM